MSVWKTSKEKKMLKKDIENGVVSSQNEAKTVYNMHDGAYHRFPYENFRNNLRNLMKASAKAAERDSDALSVACAVIAGREKDDGEDDDVYPSWFFSDARRLLLRDMKAGLLEGKQPSTIRHSRPEYMEFPPKVFRDNMYKEKQKPVTKSYWDFMKQQRQQKKHEKEEKKMKAKK